MSKNRKPQPIDTNKITRRIAWEMNVQEMREGRRLRASTFADKRKQQSRNACRGQITL
jgi:hypothetical protein